MDSAALILSPKHSETDLSVNTEAQIVDDAVDSESAMIEHQEVAVKALNAINTEHPNCMF